MSYVLTFLQKLLDKGHTPSMLKVYVADITANHSLMAGQTIGRNDLVVKFLRGAQRLNSHRPHTVPTWDLSIVIRALWGPPFEPLQSAYLRPLMLKATLLLALASVKRVGDLYALSVSASCLKFWPNNCRVVLKPRHSYVPKALSTPFRAQYITLLALSNAEGEQGPNPLCPVRALRVYVGLGDMAQKIITIIFFISVDIDNYHDTYQIFISFKFKARILLHLLIFLNKINI